MTLNKLLSAFIVIMVFFSSNVMAKKDSYIEKDFEISLKNSGQYAIIAFKLKNNAKFYWRNPGELGLATKFNFDKSLNLASAQVFWPTPTIHKSYNTSSYVYEKDTNFVAKLTPKNINQIIDLNVDISFSICQKSCNNYDLTLSSLINPSNSTLSDEIQENLVKTPSNKVDNLKIIALEQEVVKNIHYLKIKFMAKEKILSPEFFLDMPEYISFDPSKYDLSNESTAQVITIPFSIIDKEHKKIDDPVYISLVANTSESLEYETIPIDIGFSKSSSFTLMIIYALLGGLILNIMPCVLPVLALKAFQIVKLAAKKKSVIRFGLIAQSIGIVFSFMSLALISFSLKQLGHQVGLGLHFQQPIYLISMILILSFIAIYLVTNVELSVPIPQFLVKFFPKDTEAMGMLGFFLSGILLTLLAIPCTAPFVTIAIGFALTTNFLEMLIIFTSMGLGMSLPYIMMAIFPSFVNFLPKPGSWMIQFKRILGIIIFITSFWLIYIISTQLGFKAAISLFLLIVLMKFILSEKITNINNKAKILILLILIGLCYVVPQHLLEETLEQEIIVKDTWQEYKPELIATLVEKGHIIVVDVTASWCATCNINKITTLNNNNVMDYMKKMNIITMRADISKSSSSEISTLMKIHNHYGVPLNIVYSQKYPQGLVLPSLLTPGIFVSAIKKAY